MPVADEMRNAAAAFLGSLSDEQRATVQHPFEVGGERQRWYYTPTDHGGLLLSAMTTVQQQAVDVLIASALSEGGYNTARAVMALESMLDHVERWPGRPSFRARDPLRYSVTVFGSPDDRTWGWRIGGHHLSLNLTIVGDDVAATPCFMGADPSWAPLLGDDVYEPLAGAESLARAIVRDVPEAVVAAHAPWDLVLGNRSQPEPDAVPRKLFEIFRDDPDVMRPLVGRAQDDIASMTGVTDADIDALLFSSEPLGVAVTSLPTDVQASVTMLVGHYVGRLADDIAKPMFDAASDLHFAWAGSTEPDEAHYYRIQGPTLLLEYVNVIRTRGHIHAVLRDPRGDFGVRLLD